MERAAQVAGETLSEHEAASVGGGTRSQAPHAASPPVPDLRTTIDQIQPHDHLCLIYETQQEWEQATVPFVASGLAQGQKCIYILDQHTVEELRRHLASAGVDVAAVEASGQLTLLHESEAYTRGGSFSPDQMIAMLIDEAQDAVDRGYPALRVTSEMTWVLHGAPGSERMLEYEARLNRDLVSHHPCLVLSQFDRSAFDPETIKGVVMAHPLLLHGGKVHRNFYYIPPMEDLTASRSARELQHWLTTLAQEQETREALQRSDARHRRLFHESPAPLQEEDCSALKEHLTALEASGTTDLETYFRDHPDEIDRCLSLIHLTDANQAALDLYGADSLGERRREWKRVLGGAQEERIGYLLAIARGDTRFQIEMTNFDLSGRRLDVVLSCFVPPEHKHRWDKVVMAILDRTAQKKAEDRMQRSQERAQRQRAAIASLAVDEAFSTGDLSPALERLTRALSDVVHVRRSSVWVLSGDHRELRCLCLFDAAEGVHFKDMILETAVFPEYFEALLSDSRIVAQDAVHDPRTIGLSDGYLKPLGIVSLLDAAIQVDGRVIGVVSLEHDGSQRVWEPDEEAFVSTAATMVAQIMTNSERKQFALDLSESEKRFRNLFHESPVALIEEDFSSVKREMDALRADGTTDLEAHFERNPELVAAWIQKIRFVNGNLAALRLFDAKTVEDLAKLAHREAHGPAAAAFRHEFVEIFSGRRRAEHEGPARDIHGHGLENAVRLSVVPGHEAELDRVLVSITDVTDQVRARQEVERSYRQVRRTFDGTVNCLAALSEIRDPYTAGHQRAVARLSCAIARSLGLSSEQIEGLRVAALLHDIGKVSVASGILNKPGPLSDLEFRMIQEHPAHGRDILQGVDFPWPVGDIILHHHERLDGSGYPHGLKNGQILIEALILAVADVVEAMSSHRPYRPALGTDVALAEIQREAGRLYSRDVVATCIKLFEEGFALEEG